MFPRPLSVLGAMLTTFVLVACVSGVGPGGDHVEWQLTPRLTRGLELIYRGTVREQSVGNGVQFNNAWNLEARALVLETEKTDAQVGFFTKLTSQRPTDTNAKGAEEANVRLEVAQVDGLGRLTAAKDTAATCPVDGPATWEWEYILRAPPGAVKVGQSWTQQEAGQPDRKYTVVAEEPVGSTTCVKVTMEQRSDDWAKPRGDSTAWRRRDTLWLMPIRGLAYRVRRDIERREPAHREPTYQLVTEYELESALQLSPIFFEDRKREITATTSFEGKRRTLEAQPTNPKAFEALIEQLDQHAAKYAATPYRDALQRVRGQSVANMHGQRPEPAPGPAPRRLTVGKAAPDFIVQDFEKKQSIGLRTWKGKPVLMIFYKPSGGTAGLALRYVQHVAEEFPQLAVVGFSMDDDKEGVKRVTEELHLSFPTLHGKSLQISYEVEATPRMVLIDGEGTVRAKYLGWGPEVPGTLTDEVKKCLNGR